MKIYEYKINKKDLKIISKECEVIKQRLVSKDRWHPSLGSYVIFDCYYNDNSPIEHIDKMDENDYMDFIYKNNYIWCISEKEMYKVNDKKSQYLIYTLDKWDNNKLYDMIKSNKLLNNHKLTCQIEENMKIITQLDKEMYKK